MNKSTYRFFQVAIWIPAALFLSLPFLEILSRGTENVENMFVAYGLWFGTLAYLIFAMWASWYIKGKPEPLIVRLVWWAPVIFIPFYGIPWIVYGLFDVAMGEASGFAMTVLWVAFSPYIIIVGYVCVAVTFVFYHMFFNAANAGHEVMHMAPRSRLNMTGAAELFGKKVERDVFVSGKEGFASYPRKPFLGQQGLFTYHTILMIADSEFESFRELAGTVFDQVTIKQDQESICTSGDGSTLKLAVCREFNGLIIELITNSKTFLERLDVSFKAPPPPWFAFPDMEPIEVIMNKQGSLEYWWDWIWNPFWQHASDEVRMAYLKQHGASDEWIEYLAEPANGSD